MRELHNGLPGCYHLSGLGQGLDNYAVRIRNKLRVGFLISRNLFLGFGGGKVSLRRIRCGLDLVVDRSGNRAAFDQRTIPGLIRGRLNSFGLCCIDGFCSCRDGMDSVSALA